MNGMSNLPELIPMADQPHVGTEYPDEVRDTVWENPTERDAVLDLHVGTSPILGGNDDFRKSIVSRWSREQRTGLRQFVIRRARRNPPAGEAGHDPSRPVGDLIPTRARIPSEFDQGIQQTACLEPECSSRRTLCRNADHRKEIVGGYGPQLINLGARVRPRLASTLDTIMADKKLAEDRAILAAQAEEVAKREALVAQGKAIEARQHLERRDADFAAREKHIIEQAERIRELEAKLAAEKATEAPAQVTSKRRPVETG